MGLPNYRPLHQLSAKARFDAVGNMLDPLAFKLVMEEGVLPWFQTTTEEFTPMTVMSPDNVFKDYKDMRQDLGLNDEPNTMALPVPDDGELSDFGSRAPYIVQMFQSECRAPTPLPGLHQSLWGGEGEVFLGKAWFDQQPGDSGQILDAIMQLLFGLPIAESILQRPSHKLTLLATAEAMRLFDPNADIISLIWQTTVAQFIPPRATRPHLLYLDITEGTVNETRSRLHITAGPDNGNIVVIVRANGREVNPLWFTTPSTEGHSHVLRRHAPSAPAHYSTAIPREGMEVGHYAVLTYGFHSKSVLPLTTTSDELLQATQTLMQTVSAGTGAPTPNIPLRTTEEAWPGMMNEWPQHPTNYTIALLHILAEPNKLSEVWHQWGINDSGLHAATGIAGPTIAIAITPRAIHLAVSVRDTSWLSLRSHGTRAAATGRNQA